jgi:hypothetical protein
MDRKLAAIALLILLVVSAPIVVSAEISVGVKQGDWIEYQVTYSGTPPEGHAVKWARMDIGNVRGRAISLAIAAKMTDETWSNETFTLNFDAGQLGDNFIIPANLKSGDTFSDIQQGNITISGTEDRAYAGVKRVVVSGTTLQTTYYWDRATGVLVEGNSSYTGFAMYTKVDKTNMWQAQTLGLDSNVLYVLAVGATVVIVAAIAFFVIRRKK